MSRRQNNMVALVLISDAQAVPITACSTDTLSTVVDYCIQSANIRHRRFEGGHCDVRIVDRNGHAQPWDVELGLLGYPPGKVLYLRECVR